MNCELIGVNESIATNTGGNIGVGFAVPSNFVIPLLRSAKKGLLDPDRVWDGISANNYPYITQGKLILDIAQNNNNDLLRSNEMNNIGRVFPRGVLVKNIHSKSPGFKS